jgi:malonate decarboxylase gamma subunit
MDLDQSLKAIFPNGHAVKRIGALLRGSATVLAMPVEVLGIEGASIGVKEAVQLSSWFVEISDSASTKPVVVLVSTLGQRMKRCEEMLGLHEYLAHLCECQIVTRSKGHRVVTVVYGPAMGGAFICLGLMSDYVLALKGAEPSVLPLEGMARVTRIPVDRLRVLADSMPVINPSPESFWAAGGFVEYAPQDPAASLATALLAARIEWPAMRLGKERGGRTMAWGVAHAIAGLL